jgi:hypothetical protein
MSNLERPEPPIFHFGDLVRLRFTIFIRRLLNGGPTKDIFGPCTRGTHAIFIGSELINSNHVSTIYIDGQMGWVFLHDLELVQSGKSDE